MELFLGQEQGQRFLILNRINIICFNYAPPLDGMGSGRGAVSGTGTGTPILDGTGPHGAGKPIR